MIKLPVATINAAVVEAALTAVWYLASGNAENRVKLGSAGGCEGGWSARWMGGWLRLG